MFLKVTKGKDKGKVFLVMKVREEEEEVVAHNGKVYAYAQVSELTEEEKAKYIKKEPVVFD